MQNLKIKGLVIGEMPSKICVPITATTQVAILEEATAITKTKAQLVEWRCDYYEDCKDIVKVVDTLKKLAAILVKYPLIFTFRTIQEGGNCDIKTSEYLLLYKTAMLSKTIDLIDVEYMREETIVNNIIKHAKGIELAVILSHHDFDSTPPQDKIVERLRMMKKRGAQISKVAYMPRVVNDVENIKVSCRIVQKEAFPFVAISMGELGMATRLQASELGSCITFASLYKESAPGQIQIDEL